MKINTKTALPAVLRIPTFSKEIESAAHSVLWGTDKTTPEAVSSVWLMFWEGMSDGYKELMKPGRSRYGMDKRGNLDSDMEQGWRLTGLNPAFE